MGAQDLLFRVLTPDTITKVSQYKFNIEYLIVSPKHVKLPSQNEKKNAGLKEI